MSPLGRPVAHRTAGGSRRSWTASGQVSAAKDLRLSLPLDLDPLPSAGSTPEPRRRVSRRYLDDIQAVISDQDRQLLMFVQEVRLATGGQLRRVMPPGAGSDPRSAARIARRTLQRLCEWRVLDRLPGRQAGGRRGGSDSFTYHVGPAGMRLLDRMGFAGKRLATPSDRYTRHALGVAELVVRVIEAEREGVLELLGWECEPTCWRAFLGYGGSRVMLKPDAALRIGAGRLYETRYLVEYDRSTESVATLAGKLRRHLAYRASGTELAANGVDPKVLWVVPDEARAVALRELVRRLQPDERSLFAVTTESDVIDFLAREARS